MWHDGGVDLDLRLVAALAAVADEGSMSRAAGRLVLTQQAVSRQIRQLERVVGTTLVHRHSSGAELTSAGQVVVKNGRELLAQANVMINEARLAASAETGRIRIAFKPQSTAHVLPGIERALRRTVPEVEIEPVSADTLPDEIEALRTGAADAAFLWLPIGDDSPFVVHPLVDEPRCVALHPQHPLAARASLTVADLVDEPIVGPGNDVPEAVARHWYIDPRPDGSPAVHGPHGRTPGECLHLVAGGRGSWIAPASTAAYFRHPEVVWRPLTDAEPFQLGLIWTHGNPNPLLDVLLAESRQLVRPAS